MALVPFPSKSADEDPDWEDEESESSQGKMSFLEHLDELRRRIIYSVISLVVGILIACFFLPEGSWRGPILPGGLYNFVMDPMWQVLGPEAKLYFIEPMEGMMIWVKIALIGGILIAIPAIMWQVWLFVAPGLYSNEKRLALPFVLMASVFFIVGAGFAHQIVFPMTLKFFSTWGSSHVEYLPQIGPAFSLYMKLVLIFGAIFQMPTLVLFLARMGVITARFLVRNMKYAILIIFIVGAVLSPGGDPTGQILMAAPMFVLYCISIVLAWLFGKKRKRLEEAS
jgi:sec-independent protein translocase protein TatC